MMMPIVALPSEVLERIFGFLEDPDDLASCHMVCTRYVHFHRQQFHHYKQ